MGIETPEALYHGLDLTEPQGERAVLAFWRNKRDLVQEAIRLGEWKLEIVDGVARELYNLAADPYETNNQIDREPGVARELSSRIADVRDLADSVESDNREVIEQLKQIGYIE